MINFFNLNFSKNKKQTKVLGTLKCSHLADTKSNTFFHFVIKYVKGNAIQLQAWTGPEGSRRLRLPDFKTIGT
jgi:hypothetical protein